MTDPPEWFTEALSAPVKEGTVDVDGCSIAFRRWGDEADPGVVLVHGDRAHARWWDHVAPLLADRRTVVALDLSGHGESGHRAAYRWESWADEILAVIGVASGGARPPVLVAHSMGSMPAMVAVARSPESVSGVILVDSAVLSPIPPPVRDPADKRPLKTYPTIEAAVANFRLQPRQPNALAYVVDHIARTSLRPVEGGWTWKFDPELWNHEMTRDTSRFSAITCPVGVITVGHGRTSSVEIAMLEEAVAHPVSVIDIPGAYHHVMIDEPLALADAVRSFLQAWEAAPRR
jgi:pimeloyl-ACP methyl ester carboxylesterase